LNRKGNRDKHRQSGTGRAGQAGRDRQGGTGRAGQAGRDNRIGQAEQDKHNEQVALDRKKMTGRTGLPEQVSQDKNAETDCQDGQPEYDSQNRRDERDRQNRTKTDCTVNPAKRIRV
jgi:hypothetical protein